MGQELLSRLLQESTPTQLIENCKFLEDSVGVCGFTKAVLNGSILAREVKAIIKKEDLHNLLAVVSQHPSTQIAASIAAHVSWLKLYDVALDWGVNGMKWMQALVKVMIRPVFGSTPCPLCSIDNLEQPCFSHFVKSHTAFSSP